MSPSDDSSSHKGPSRRRTERADVRERLRGVFLRCLEISPKDIRVLNISELGVAIDVGPGIRVPEVGVALESKLLIGAGVTPLQMELVHVIGTVAGFEFIEPSELLRGAVRSYFEPELVGANLRPVLPPGPPPAPPDPAKPHTLHFADDRGNTLELSVDKKLLVSAVITVLGNQIEWRTGGMIETLQNGKRDVATDFMRRELAKMTQNAYAIDHVLRSQLGRVLQLLPPVEAK